jgi:4-oxalocrotonate tautomerase
MFSGRTQKEKDRFAEAVTENAVKILGVDRKDVIHTGTQEEPHGKLVCIRC